MYVKYIILPLIALRKALQKHTNEYECFHQCWVIMMMNLMLMMFSSLSIQNTIIMGISPSHPLLLVGTFVGTGEYVHLDSSD